MKKAIWALGVLALVTVSVPETAAAQGRVKVGALNCRISPGIGLIVGSRRELSCSYAPAGDGPHERYHGSVTRVGLDIGATSGGRMSWLVYAPSAPGPGALAGTYAGASGEASVVAGVGANALVGGSNRTVALQPVSVQSQAGLNLALGVAGLELGPGR